MCAYFTCAAFRPLEARLSDRNGCVYLSLRSGQAVTHITLNANQARLLGEALQNIAGQMPLSVMREESALFGDFTAAYGGEPKEEAKVVPIKAA